LIFNLLFNQFKQRPKFNQVLADEINIRCYIFR